MEVKATYKGIINQIKQLLDNTKQSIVVVSHYNPDGDSIGSILSLYHFLRQLGHTVTAISPDEFPHFLQWMPGSKEILIHTSNRQKAEESISQADIIFMVDFNHPDRLNDFEKYAMRSRAKKILIDHHPHPADFPDIIYSDIDVSSTAELIYHLLYGIDSSIINQDIATCLFTGIMTDTGCFSFNSSGPATYHIVAELLKKGINKDLIFSRVYENFSHHRMNLLGYCLNEKMIINQEYHTAIISLSQKELLAYSFMPGDTEGFVNYPFSIKNIAFTVLLIEKEDHIKMSFRSKNSFAANDFARKHFNGGGHMNAAGGKSFLTMDDTIEKFVNLLPQYKSELENALLS